MAQDFAKVDAAVKNYPASFATPDKFAERVNADFKNDEEKARAIFTWIATNVKYDLAAYGVNEKPVAYSFKTEDEKRAKQKEFRDELALKTLRSKKGVCQGYSTLFLTIAEKCGLEAAFISGTSKSHPMHIGKAPGASDHAWNAVKIGNEWKLLDTTWGAGVVTGARPAFQFKFNDAYFFAEPDVFFLNHFPDDKRWLLTAKTEKDFENLPLFYGNYLSEGYEFVSPVTGTISNPAVQVADFKIKNLKPGDKVHYVFSNEKVFKEAVLQQTGTIAEFKVPLPLRANGTLTVYINQKSVAAYRIER
ncbi:transglutaminase domain-containing protein [Flavobacterium rhizosphaerae]|uniref:transglutaminase domain-containing protein n=1 Tax=Flavobacterium rhizosphaerae TaxID=3163298 RepID=UPI0038B4C0A3